MSWVEKICKDYGLTQYRLSQITGISQSTLSSAKSAGSKLNSYHIIKRLSKALGASVDELKRWYG